LHDGVAQAERSRSASAALGGFVGKRFGAGSELRIFRKMYPIFKARMVGA
jgi:hypothetical protein